jgi:hypothetical protein
VEKKETIYDRVSRLFNDFRLETGGEKPITPTDEKTTVPIILEDNTIGEATIISSLKTMIGQLATYKRKVGRLIPVDKTDNFIFEPLVKNKNKDNL